MTVVIGIKTKTGVMMGCDSFSGTEFLNERTGDAKVQKIGSFLIGMTGGFRVFQLITTSSIFKELKPKGNPFNFMINKFIPCLQDLLAKNDCKGVEDNLPFIDGHLLVAFGCNLFTVQNCLQVLRHGANYQVIGSGQQVALGALFTTKQEIDLRKRLLKCLQAAECYVPTVSKPFIIKIIGELK